MDRSTSHRPSAPGLVTRAEIRSAVLEVVEGILRARLSSGRRSGRPLRLTKNERARAIKRATIVEELLYRRASSQEEYQDMSTLERRAIRASRMVCQLHMQRIEEAEARQRNRGGGDDADAALPGTAGSSQS